MRNGLMRQIERHCVSSGNVHRCVDSNACIMYHVPTYAHTCLCI